jgi:hypothetical protein
MATPRQPQTDPLPDDNPTPAPPPVRPPVSDPVVDGPLDPAPPASVVTPTSGGVDVYPTPTRVDDIPASSAYVPEARRGPNWVAILGTILILALVIWFLMWLF